MAMKSSSTWTKDESACEVQGFAQAGSDARGGWQSCLQALSPESGGCHGNATSRVVEDAC